MPKPIAIETVIIGSVHLCRSEKSERKRNAGIAQVIYLATLIGQSNPVFIIMYTAKNALYILLFRLIPYKSVEITKIIDKVSGIQMSNRDWSEVKAFVNIFAIPLPVFCLIFEKFKAVACNFIIA